VAAGYDYSIAADVNGVVWTWGQDNDGQLANGIDNSSNITPAPISGVSNIVSVTAGEQHTLLLRSDGTVWVAGSDQYGQLGVGGLSSPSYTNSPIQSLVPTGTVIVAIAAGAFRGAALDESGNVWTWGEGTSGQLGNGGFTNVTTPMRLTTISNAVAVAAGYWHSMAVTADKTLWTWGDNSGELGRSGTNSLPRQVFAPGLSNNVVDVTGGYFFTLAVTTNGDVYGWGSNFLGQLGTNNVPVDSGTNLPVLVVGISNAVLVSAHPNGIFSLAETVDQGTEHVWGWGQNNSGEVGTTDGDESFYGNIIVPTPEALQFCSNVQLGTGGVFTATCTGNMTLYFNDTSFDDNSGAYTVTVCNASMTCTTVVVEAANSSGVAIGAVSNGATYSYSATGFCVWASALECTVSPDCSTDANGYHADGEVANCVTANWTPEACSAPCPALQCFSLVGKIEQ
jgi:alpha-tubulin suppressor-like RCC1 family protein